MEEFIDLHQFGLNYEQETFELRTITKPLTKAVIIKGRRNKS